ncbi:nucleotidyltransferase domain-containing protein [Candidatus Woesearchaeota archaeon]|nr:nucleotidyltransferase domain-containing protein [Candidatus Woesearchaeota archaeon]
MKQNNTLSSLLGNKPALNLLLFFAQYPNTELSYTQLKNEISLAKATLTKWLAVLEKEKLINVKKIGTTKLYKANKESIFLKQFKILNTLSSLNFFATISQKHNVESYLFGSAARGEDHENSDLDILIIGKIKKEELLTEIEKRKPKNMKKIQLQIFTPLEWSTLATKDKPFYERVEKDKIALQ